MSEAPPMEQLTDSRVLFAAERTLLAWNRTCVAMMGFGFVVERFGLFLRLLAPRLADGGQRDASYWVGLTLIVFSTALALASVVAFRHATAVTEPRSRTPQPFATLGIVANLGLAVAGIGLTIYLATAAR